MHVSGWHAQAAEIHSERLAALLLFELTAALQFVVIRYLQPWTSGRGPLPAP